MLGGGGAGRDQRRPGVEHRRRRDRDLQQLLVGRLPTLERLGGQQAVQRRIEPDLVAIAVEAQLDAPSPAELRAVWLQGPFPAVADWCASQALPDCGPDPARGEASRRGAIDRITAVRATDGQGTRVGFAVHTTQGWFVADIAEYVQTDGPNRVQARLDVARPGKGSVGPETRRV